MVYLMVVPRFRATQLTSAYDMQLLRHLKAGEISNSLTESAFEDKPCRLSSLLERLKPNPMGIGERFADYESTARFEDAIYFSECALLVGNLTECDNQVSSVKCLVWIGKRLHIALCWDNIRDVVVVCSIDSMIEHLTLKIENMECTVRCKPSSHREAIVPGSWPDFEDSLGRCRFEEFLQFRPCDERMGQV